MEIQTEQTDQMYAEYQCKYAGEKFVLQIK